jgi:ADP-heptose:LPS heptosyltransferase
MQKFLVIQTAFIGDAVLTLPMIQELKRQNSGSLVDVLCTPVTKEIFASSASVNKVISIDKRGEHRTIASLYKLSKEISSAGYTDIYSAHRSFRSALIVLFSNVRNTTGFENSSFNFVYKNLVKYNNTHHEVSRNLELIGFDTSSEEWKILPEVKAEPESIAKVKSFKNRYNLENYIVIAPASVWNTKAYPIDYFKAVAEYFLREKYKVVLIGGAKDKDSFEGFNECGAELISAAGEFSLIESVELLRGSKLLISNDSAPTHLGLCADIPILTLYCSTVPAFGFYPYSPKSFYLSIDGLKCKPCGIHGKNECPLKTFECGKKLIPELVIKKSEEIINGEYTAKFVK